MQINLDLLRMDGGTQTRAVIDETTVNDYAESMQNENTFPPIVVYHDGAIHWLADGFHRVRAARKCGKTELEADVRQGTRRDAVLFSVGANADHGLRRTNADKRRGVITLLGDEEWKQWSDREIARRCGVGNKFVSNVRAELYPPSVFGTQIERKAERNGTTYTQNTANIGMTPRVKPALPPDTPHRIAERVDAGLLGIPQAIKLTRAIEKASPEIKAAVVKAEIDDPAMVDMLEEKKDTETVQSLISTGMLQPGEEKDAKSITQITPLDLERELRAREKEHKQRGIELKREQIRDGAAKQAELTGAYSVIYADPPWEYQNSGIDASAASRYPTMPTADICGLLKANKIEATENAALFLWATNPLLLDALKVLEVWGFTYRTNLVWTKNNHAGGFYVRGQHELLLIATRGSFLPVLTYSSHLHAPITRHSEKPPILYTMIESMYPKQQYLELFARDVEQRKDWTYWGGEVKYANAA